MKKRNTFLAAVLSAAMISGSAAPVFAETLTDGETAVMEMTEEPETEEIEEIPEITETPQEPEITEIPEITETPQITPAPEITEAPDVLPMEEAETLPQGENDEAEELLEAPETTAGVTTREEYTKELIAKTAASAVNPADADSAAYGVRTPDTLYYTAFKLYDEDDQFMGIEVDQYTSANASWQTHWLTYIWYADTDEWGVYEYSEELKDLNAVYLDGRKYHNVWGNMYWLLEEFGGDVHAVTGYQINTAKAVWDYTYTANDVKKDMQHKEWDNTLDVPDAFYKGACGDLTKRAGLRNIQAGIYYLMKDGKMVRNKKVIVNGKAYLFGNDCRCYKSYVPVEEKWIKKSDGYYWLQDDNTILREGGWQTLGGSRYFLAYKSGRRKTGWQTWKGNKYYMAPATGRLVTGLKTIDGNTYFLQYKTGEMVKGWKQLGKAKYYFNEQTGIMKKGMLTLNGKKYYFAKDGKQHFGWKSISGKQYFFDRKTGIMKQNTWIIDGNSKYYANKNGTRFSGIRSIKGKNYYFAGDGRLVTNKRAYKINGKTYSIDRNGVLTEAAK